MTSARPSSPASSDCEFFDCKSDVSSSVFWTGVDMSCENPPPTSQEPPPAMGGWRASSLWELFGWSGSSTKSRQTRTTHRRSSLEKGIDETEQQEFHDSDSFDRGNEGRSASDTTIDPNQSRVLSALSHLMHHPKEPTTSQQPTTQERLPNGSSFERREETCTFEEARERWEPADATKYRIRSKNYLKTRTKEPCKGAFYDVIGSDLISFPKKQTHVAQMIQLPDDPYKRTAEEKAAIAAAGLPTLLVVNMQLPVYQPSLFGSCDGPGHSFVFYCVLREHFNPETFQNQAALCLFQRFIKECRNQTQYRIKLIPKFLNVDEWAEKGPLSATEHRLVHQFNEKPILTRPYQQFFDEKSYFEIDVDVHSWLYVARKALWALLPRMHEVITEVALLIQGNRAEDLPEHIVAVARVYRVDLAKFRYVSNFFPQQSTEEDNENHAVRERLTMQESQE